MEIILKVSVENSDGEVEEYEPLPFADFKFAKDYLDGLQETFEKQEQRAKDIIEDEE